MTTNCFSLWPLLVQAEGKSLGILFLVGQVGCCFADMIIYLVWGVRNDSAGLSGLAEVCSPKQYSPIPPKPRATERRQIVLRTVVQNSILGGPTPCLLLNRGK